MHAPLVRAIQRFLEHIRSKPQARAVVSIPDRMTHAVLASGREKENGCGMCDVAPFAYMLDEHAAVRNDNVVISRSLRGAAPRLVRAGADARDVDQLRGEEPLVVQRRLRLNCRSLDRWPHPGRLGSTEYGVNPERRG